jgi:hypothetical protein
MLSADVLGEDNYVNECQRSSGGMGRRSGIVHLVYLFAGLRWINIWVHMYVVPEWDSGSQHAPITGQKVLESLASAA